jgi:hypothetical protein
MKTELIDSLDFALQRLLDKAGLGATVGLDASRLDIVDQVKVFAAAVDWAKTRQTLAPAANKESPFDGLRAKFNSPPLKRRRGRAAAEAEGGSAEPVGDTDGGNASEIRPVDGAAAGAEDGDGLFDP